MSTPNQDDIKELLPLASNEMLDNIEKILEFIDCPEDFRGLQKVHASLLYLFKLNQAYFSQAFEIDIPTLSKLFDLFTDINPDHYKQYSNPVSAKGWMSQRPLYSLLFIFYDHQNELAANALLFFISHYLRNESAIAQENRVESSIRAFRLLYTDNLIDRRCFNVNLQEPQSSLLNTIATIQEVREHLKEEEDLDDDTSPSSRIGYLRELEHFYRLDWKKRRNYTRTTNKTIRMAYHRTKIERVVGSDYLYTTPLKKTYLAKQFIDAGVTSAEDFPELHVIKTEQPTQPKPKHELPDISVIKDQAKIQHKARVIAKDVRRSHNLTPINRNVLQPHELHYLWCELRKTRNKPIQRIPGRNIKCVIMLILLTGRKLDAISNLTINSAHKEETSGLVVTPTALELKVSPKPTADMSKHSNNPHLLKTCITATITLPPFMHQYFINSELNGQHTLSGQFTAIKYRKAIESWLKNVNKKYHCQIGLKRIEHYLSNSMMAREKHDPVLLEILSGELSYCSRSPRHYAWYSEEEVNQKAQDIWAEMFEQIQLYDPQYQLPTIKNAMVYDEKIGIGSQYTPTKEALTNWIAQHRRKLEQWSTFDTVKNIAELINYHNQYTVYTLILLINASGYRAVYNPLPSFDLLLIRYHALCISDKDSSKTFSHTRIIACPSILETQLRYYQKHVQTMANLIYHHYPRESQQFHAQCCDHQAINLPSKVEKLEWFLSVKNSHTNDGLFLRDNPNNQGNEDEQSSIRVQNSGPKYLREFIDLPLNFGRHYVRRYLQCHNVHQELIKFQLGHWVVGETPLEKCSSLVHSEAINHLLPHLDDMLNELNWQAVPSLITRKRA